MLEMKKCLVLTLVITGYYTINLYADSQEFNALRNACLQEKRVISTKAITTDNKTPDQTQQFGKVQQAADPNTVDKQKIMPNQIAERIDMLNEQIMSIFYEGKFSECAELAQQIYAIFLNVHGNNWWETRLARQRMELYLNFASWPTDKQVQLVNSELLARQALHLIDEDNFSDAESLFRQVLATEKILFGAEHEFIANTYYDLGFCMQMMDRPIDALSWYKKALEMKESLFPNQAHPDIVKDYHELAFYLHSLERFEDSIFYYLQAWAMYQDLYPNQNRHDILHCLTHFANCYHFLQRYSEALPLYKLALEMGRNLFTNAHLELATFMNNLANCYSSLKMSQDALPLYEHALEIRQDLIDGDYPIISENMYIIAFQLMLLGRYPEAEPYYRQAWEMEKRIHPGDHPAVTQSLQGLAFSLYKLNRFPEALSLYEQELDIFKRIFNNQSHPIVVQSLISVANCHDKLGHNSMALSFYDQALKMQNNICQDKPDAEVAEILKQIAHVYFHNSEYSDAMPFLKKSLEMLKIVYLNQSHHDVADVLSDITLCHLAIGNYSEGLSSMKESLEITRGLYPSKPHVAVADALTGLGSYFMFIGQINDASLFIYEAFEMYNILSKQKQLTHHERKDILNGLTFCSILKANCELQIGTHTEALSTIENLDTIDENWIIPVNYIKIGCYLLSGRLSEIPPLLEESQKIYQSDPIGFSPYEQAFLSGKAEYLTFLNRNDEALEVYDELLTSLMSHPGGHNTLARLYVNISIVHTLNERPIQAAENIIKAMRVDWNTISKYFPLMTESQKKLYLNNTVFIAKKNILNELCMNGTKIGDNSDAIKIDPKMGFESVILGKNLIFEALRLESQILSESVSEELKRKYKMHEQLRRRQATLFAQNMRPIGLLPNPKFPDQHTIQQQSQKLAVEIELSDRILRQSDPEYAKQVRMQQITIDDVFAALQPGEILLEYVRYPLLKYPQHIKNNIRNLKEGKYFEDVIYEYHYGVYVLYGGTNKIRAIYLGDTKKIDAVIKDYRNLEIKQTEFYRAGGSSFIKEKKLAEKAKIIKNLVLNDQIIAEFDRIKRIYIAPDGPLALIPFEAFPIEIIEEKKEIHYLAEEKDIIYLTTARDLARLCISGSVQPNKTALLIGDPDFSASPRLIALATLDMEQNKPAKQENFNDPIDTQADILGGLKSLHTSTTPLPQTRKLIADANEFFLNNGWQVEVKMREKATEMEPLLAQSPQVLQIATHGYFREESESINKIRLSIPLMQSFGIHYYDPNYINPLSRSMLVFAGRDTLDSHPVFYKFNNKILTANQAHRQGLSEENLTYLDIGDGLLTAYEVTGMNLHNTELVNLTACQSGVGDVSGSEGIAGLRSAFIMAGARSLTMSMWVVPTNESVSLYRTFYDNWQNKDQGRYQAFHNAQIEALDLARKKRGGGHPFWWAGFVYIGDPGDLPARKK